MASKLFVVPALTTVSVLLGGCNSQMATQSPRAAKSTAETQILATKTVTVTPRPTTPTVAPPVNAGGTAVDGNFAFSVIKSDMDDAVHEDEQDQVNAQGEFVLLEVQIENIGRTPQTYTADYQRLVDGRGREFGPDRDAMWAGYIKELHVDINPGNKTSAMLVFDVPKGSEPDQYVLSLRDSPESAGVLLSVPPLPPLVTFAPTAADDQKFLQKLAAEMSNYPAIYPSSSSINAQIAVNVAHEACTAISSVRHTSASDFQSLNESLSKRWSIDSVLTGTIVTAALSSYPNC